MSEPKGIFFNLLQVHAGMQMDPTFDAVYASSIHFIVDLQHRFSLFDNDLSLVDEIVTKDLHLRVLVDLGVLGCVVVVRR
jgi:hypothetical protein